MYRKEKNCTLCTIIYFIIKINSNINIFYKVKFFKIYLGLHEIPRVVLTIVKAIVLSCVKMRHYIKIKFLINYHDKTRLSRLLGFVKIILKKDKIGKFVN